MGFESETKLNTFLFAIPLGGGGRGWNFPLITSAIKMFIMFSSSMLGGIVFREEMLREIGVRRDGRKAVSLSFPPPIIG